MENGNIFDTTTQKEKKPDRAHQFRLLTIDSKPKKISQKKLYKELFEKEQCVDNIKSLENEEQKEIDKTEGRYFISNMGRVKSLDGYEAIILKPYTSKTSKYQRVDIFEDGIRVSKLIHKLVALYFLPFVQPANPLDIEIHHKDLDISNNKADNLIYIDSSKHKQLHRSIRRNNNA